MRSSCFAKFLLLLSLLFAQLCLGQERPESSVYNETPPQLVMKAPLAEGKEVIITSTEYAEGSTAKIKEILESSATQNMDVMVSTDQESVLDAVADATAKPGDKRLLRIIPLGKLASAQQKLASGFKNYYQNAKNTLTSDRIGLAVVTITFGVDTYIWLHAASFDIHQKTSMILMNLVMAATFGLDRDLWSKMTKPIKTKLINVFDKFLVQEKYDTIKTLTSQFTANMLFGLGVQAIRTGLLSLDHISEAVISSPFWLTAAKIASLSTLTSFAWTELMAAINEEKHPVAKYMMKRIGDTRGIIMCQLATISMVLQPEVYGSVPIISYVVHGSLGLIALANAKHIINFLETNALVGKIYKKIETFENFINRSMAMPFRKQPVVRSCRSLFAS